MKISGSGASGHLTSRPGVRRGANYRFPSLVEGWRWKRRCSHVGSGVRVATVSKVRTDPFMTPLPFFTPFDPFTYVNGLGNMRMWERAWVPDGLRASEAEVLATGRRVRTNPFTDTPHLQIAGTDPFTFTNSRD